MQYYIVRPIFSNCHPNNYFIHNCLRAKRFSNYSVTSSNIIFEMVKIVDNYTLTEVIGQGQYGKVYRATHVDTKMNVAVKCIRVEKFREVNKLTECTSNEIETLMLIQDNINIVKFVEMIKTANHIYLVYEYCEGGTLDGEMRKSGFFPEKRALLYFKQLMNAFKALSSNNILHRDIKPDNILLKSGHLKLADFGFCKRMQGPDDLTQTVLGSPVYMAPEVLNGDLYNSKADIWSLGVVLFEMLFGYCPFNEGSMSDFLKHIDNFKIEIPTNKNPISSITEGLLRRMLEKDHFRRISWEDLFYEYQVTEYGVLTRREKGFEYDLMKLMKKNSYNQPEEKPQKQVSFKFNWEKIADGKSSVRSDELEGGQQNGDLDKIVGVKRKLKEFTGEHSKLMNASTVLGEVVKKKYSKLAEVIAYYICSMVGGRLTELRKQVEEFRFANQQYLPSNPTEN
jgi:serine/threonine protein kinase